jgi:hypothetical protein
MTFDDRFGSFNKGAFRVKTMAWALKAFAEHSNKRTKNILVLCQNLEN